jgi:uncharacterized protein (TIGR02117 family)
MGAMMLLRWIRWLGKILAVLLGAVLLYLIAALALGAIPVNRDFEQTADGTEISVCSNGVHTDFVLPAVTSEMDWSAPFPASDFARPVGVFDHVGIGWGDFDFYRATPTWADFELGTALHALAGLGPSALHVQYRRAPGPQENCRKLRLDAAHYRALADAILATRAPGSAVFGYGGTDAFYPATGRFSLFKSCNVWVGDRLKAAGLPSAVWTPFAFQVLNALDGWRP